MSHEERNTAAAILTNVLVIGYLIWRLTTMNGAGAFAGPDGLALWAQTVLWVIPISIVATIVTTILFNIAHAIVTRDENPDFTIDERDKQIGNRGTLVTVIVASAGFILALAMMAFFGWGALPALTTILFGFALGDLAGNVAKIILWRRGY